MTYQLLMPFWLIVAIFGTLAVLTVVLAFRTWRDGLGWKWLLRFAMVACLCWIALRPTTPDPTMGEVRSNVDIFFVVDRTGSISAEDYDITDEDAKPRLDGIKADIQSIVADMPGARYSIIGFDSVTTTGLPLTTDANAVTAWADTVTQEISRYSTGSSIDRPYDQLAAALVSAKKNSPEDVRLVFFLSDGEQTVDSKPRSFEELASLIDGGAVLGYGTEQGGKMMVYRGPTSKVDPSESGFIMDESKNPAEPAISKIDETNLKTLADQLGVPYEHRTVPDPTAFLTKGIDVKQIADDGRAGSKYFDDWFWPAAGVLAVLLCWQVFDFTFTASRAVKPAGQLPRKRSETDEGGSLGEAHD